MNKKEITFSLTNELLKQFKIYCIVNNTTMPKALRRWIRSLRDIDSLIDFLLMFTKKNADSKIERREFRDRYNKFRESKNESPLTITKLNWDLERFPYIVSRQMHPTGLRYYVGIEWL